MSNALSELLKRLNLIHKKKLFYFEEDNWQKLLPLKIFENIQYKICPTAFYIIDTSQYDEIERLDNFIFFFDNPSEHSIREIHKSCWNFAKASVVFIILPSEIQILNGFSFDSKKGFLRKLAEERDINNFSYLELISGKTWEIYEKEFRVNKRIDELLLKNIGEARAAIIEDELPSTIANSLIGRLIFTRYLIDRKVKIDFKLSEDNTNSLPEENNFTIRDFNELLEVHSVADLYKFFEYLDGKFLNDANENLFPSTQEADNTKRKLNLNEEKKFVKQEHLKILHSLFIGSEIYSNQLKLDFQDFRFYDFEIIPVEFISNIYELFMGNEKQKTNKSYYTPPFLAEYILNQTINNFYQENPNEYNCKVLDPSCGSGIFLVETLRRIINQYQKINHLAKSDLKNHLKDLVCNNIFGVDKDPDAINIAIFSIYITLLDYQEPRDIGTFKFPKLRDNFFEGDFFDVEFKNWNLFSKKITEINFDFVIGNPPWGTPSSSREKGQYEGYCEERARNEKLANTKLISNREIAQAFLIRVSDLSQNKSTPPQCVMIVTSKILYNLNAKFFRNYFVDKFEINQVIELSSVRKQVFHKRLPKIKGNKDNSKSTTGPPTIIFYKYANAKNTDDNVVKHISIKPNLFFKLFRIIVIEKFDYKEIAQNFFKEYDWLWKTLVYGNILDYHLIKRLLNKHTSIRSFVLDKSKFIVGKGISINGGDSYPVHFLLNKKFIDTKQNDLKPFSINMREESNWNIEYVHRSRNNELYYPPVLLIKKGIRNDLRAVSAVYEGDEPIAYTDSITAIKAIKGSDSRYLHMISGLINSEIFTYFLLQTGTSLGIEREQAHDKFEKFLFPFIYNEGISHLVREIHNYAPNISDFENLNDLIFKLYKLSKSEKSLIDYALKISIPLFKQKETPYRKLNPSNDKNYLNSYGKVFLNHFTKYYENTEKYFHVDIYYSEYLIGMNFIIGTSKPDEEIRLIEDRSQTEILSFFGYLSFEQISRQVYFQKDIKGFNRNSFYVIKPNEYKVWHEAIAYLDLGEFLESILTTGAKQKALENTYE